MRDDRGRAVPMRAARRYTLSPFFSAAGLSLLLGACLAAVSIALVYLYPARKYESFDGRVNLRERLQPELTYTMIGGIALVLVAGTSWTARRARTGGGIAHDRLVLLHCAACEYDLKTVAASPDGCLVCPECGAAWRTAKFEKPAPSASSPPPPLATGEERER